MNITRLLAAIVAVLTLSACVGIVVPIPVKSSTSSSQSTDQNEQR